MESAIARADSLQAYLEDVADKDGYAVYKGGSKSSEIKNCEPMSITLITIKIEYYLDLWQEIKKSHQLLHHVRFWVYCGQLPSSDQMTLILATSAEGW